MNRKKTVLFLCGGKSPEHEISLISAKMVLQALDKKRFEPLLVGISRQGVWYLEQENSFYLGDFRADRIKLNTRVPTITLAPFLSNDGRGHLFCEGESFSFDVVFPILHGAFGEDGTLQGMLEILGIPFVGSRCGASWNCMDKERTKLLAQAEGIPVVEFVTLRSVEECVTKQAAIAALGFPLFVKPCCLGSSVGITKVTSPAELESAVNVALAQDTKCLIERGIDAREIETAVLGNRKNLRVAPPGEIVLRKDIPFYSYEAKYLSQDAATAQTPAHLTEAQQASAEALARKAFTALECDGMARVDLFLERPTGKFYLNEINTIPGFTPISMYPKMWESAGLSYPDLITQLLDLALQPRKGQ